MYRGEKIEVQKGSLADLEVQVIIDQDGRFDEWIGLLQKSNSYCNRPERRLEGVKRNYIMKLQYDSPKRTKFRKENPASAYEM